MRIVRSTRVGMTVALLLTCGATGVADAASLKNKLQRISDEAAYRLTDSQSPVVNTVIPFLATLSARGIDFPSASTAAGFVYTYNPDLDLFERSPSLGPALAERANTTGAHRLDIGFSYLHANLSRLNGDAIEDTPRNVAVFAQGFGSLGAFPAKETFTEFSLSQDIFSFNATYGITSRWDVNLLVPVIWTKLEATAAVFQPEDPGGAGTAGFGGTSKLGVGDILVRSKYRFELPWPVDTATMVTLRIPSGSQGNFQGLGDWTVTPWLILSKVFSKGDVHFNFGFEANASQLDNSQIRYALGGSWQPIEGLALLADVIGNSGVDETTVDQSVPLRGSPSLFGVSGALEAAGIDFTSLSRSGNNAIIGIPIERADIVNLAVGAKFTIIKNLLGYVEVILPLTNDGVRAQFAPTAGLQYGF